MLHLSTEPLDHEFDGYAYRLSPDCGDDALRTAAALLCEIATLRGSLSAARRSAGALQQLATTDALTGLHNRRGWDDALAQLATNIDGRPATACAAIVDLDRFKLVNDRHGHAVGDAVLRAAADALRAAVRRGDVVARLGGDEFGLLLVDVEPPRVAAVVERLRRAVGTAIVAAGLPDTTCSAGYCVIDHSMDAQAAAIYSAAADALRQAKQAGRNRTVGVATC